MPPLSTLLPLVSLVAGAVLFFTWRALLRAAWCHGLTLAETDMKACIERLFAERIAYIDGEVEKVGVHTDQIIFLESSIKSQGSALAASLTAAIEQQTRAMEHIANNTTTTMREIKHAVEDVSEATAENARTIARVAGFLEAQQGYAGEERRERQTRRPRGVRD